MELSHRKQPKFYWNKEKLALMLFCCLMKCTDNEENLYNGVTTFTINRLKKSTPFVIKAIPEIKIEGKWLSEHIDNCISSLNSVGFNVCAIISDNHLTNVLAFKYLFNMYRNEQEGENILITHPVQPTISICFLIQCTY